MEYHVPAPDSLHGDRAHIAPATHHFNSSQASPPIHFKHPGALSIEPNLSISDAGRGLSASPQPNIGEGFTATPRGARTPSTPPLSLANRSPSVQRQTVPGYTPTDRPLPSREVTDETIDDAYVDFILYCNPSFPLTTDTSELRKIFRQPPRSDGKQFSIWHLYELVKRYEVKDIKTWGELALELGVEKPALDKGQSSQKVQQYTVRLKRWLRAMHVDAFFDYLRDSPKEYYTQIPSPFTPQPEEGRDGVPAEEDLAIRALDPSKRPKRGRRKADEMEDDADRGVTPDGKQPRTEGANDFSASNGFAVPSSAYPHDYGDTDTWTVASAITPASLMPKGGPTPSSAYPMGVFRWKSQGNLETPITPYPLSAITPASAHPDSAWGDEPQSAITPRGKTRRRHGPTISSAWSSTANSSKGRQRGRPPSNRVFRDGPFSSFPAKPGSNIAELARTPISSTTPVYPPITIPQDVLPQNNTNSPVPLSSTSTQPPTSAKRERLSLQVPKRASGPVHLISPPAGDAHDPMPPTVLVNGQDREAELVESPRRGSVFFPEPFGDERLDIATASFAGRQPAPSRMSFAASRSLSVQATDDTGGNARMPAETLKRALARDLLRASLVGRKRKRLRGAEAKGLAAAILKRVEDQTVEQAAAWLGLSGESGLGDSPGRIAGNGKRIAVHRFRIGQDGYDSPIDDDDDDEMFDEPNDAQEDISGMRKRDTRKVKETFDVSWSMSLGGISGDFRIRALAIAVSDESGGDDHKTNASLRQELLDSSSEWRDKYVKAQLEVRAMEKEIERLTEKMLDDAT